MTQVSLAEALCNNDADRHEIRETIHGCDKGKLLDECEGRINAVLVVRIEREIGRCKLWAVASAYNVHVWILTYLANTNNCYLKCDVAHVIDMHVSAEFSAVDLLNSSFPAFYKFSAGT